MNIMGPPSASLEVVQRNLREQNRGSLFVDSMVPALYKEAQRAGVDPVVMIAQSAKETNYGRFTGKVQEWFFNPAGIKVSPKQQALLKVLKDAAGINDPDHALDHQIFPSWTMGARAQATHLRRYAGIPVPEDEVVHARYWVVPLYRLRTVEELSGKWAPGTSYGSEVVAIARTLIEVGL